MANRIGGQNRLTGTMAFPFVFTFLRSALVSHAAADCVNLVYPLAADQYLRLPRLASSAWLAANDGFGLDG